MKKILTVIVLLVVLAAPALADPMTAAVTNAWQANWNDATGTLTLALYYTGPGTQAGQYVNSFAAEMSLNGTAAGLFTAIVPNFVNAAAVQTLITNTVGGTYALSNLTGVIVSNNYGDTASGFGSTSFEVQATATNPPANEVVGTGPFSTGNILAIFQFQYAPGATFAIWASGGSLLPQVTALGYAGQYDPTDLTNTAASFLGGATAGGNNANTMPIYVINNNPYYCPEHIDLIGDLIPEPTTMGLLGLGLVGLVIRRKKVLRQQEIL